MAKSTAAKAPVKATVKQSETKQPETKISSPQPQPKRALGKGLSALMSESYSQVSEEPVAEQKSTSTKKPANWQNMDEEGKSVLAIQSVQPGKFQPRRHFDTAALAELTESIRKNGVMQPILVRPIGGGKYEIIAGERRWRASQMAGLYEIPVFIRELNDETALELALVENIQRKDLNPIEEAAGYQRLMDEFGYTQEMLATTVHKSRSHIANLLRLLALPEDIRQMVETDQLSMGHARALMTTPNPAALAQEVIRRGLNVRQTEKLALVEKGGEERKPRKPRGTMTPLPETERAALAIQTHAQAMHAAQAKKDPDILALEQTLSENLGLKVAITDRGQAGEINIAYESLEQLDEILRRLGGSI